MSGIRHSNLPVLRTITDVKFHLVVVQRLIVSRPAGASGRLTRLHELDAGTGEDVVLPMPEVSTDEKVLRLLAGAHVRGSFGRSEKYLAES